MSKHANLALAPPAESGMTMKSASAEQRTARAARRTKQSQQEIERLPFDLSALDEDGIFVVRRVTYC